LLVLATGDAPTLLNTAYLARKRFPNLPVLARAKNRGDVTKLQEAGVVGVRREMFAASLEVGELALRELGFKASQAQKTIEKFKGYDEKMLQASAVFQGDEKSLIDYAKRSHKLLEQLMTSDKEELSKADKG
ncbi:MAG: glutathione-regulated potassium-efflux system protein KefC, partial [Kordiimonadaceae bacterium]|nr:glutathione-regulated potassium-efflux system protein KefC [Kordiimonadaceae bacterium]